MYKNINDLLNSREIRMFKAFCELQLNMLSNDEDFDAIFFTYDGTEIVNPFYDEICWNEVDPIEYYGDYFLNSKFMEFIK